VSLNLAHPVVKLQIHHPCRCSVCR